jgi:hypothetical protein
MNPFGERLVFQSHAVLREDGQQRVVDFFDGQHRKACDGVGTERSIPGFVQSGVYTGFKKDSARIKDKFCRCETENVSLRPMTQKIYSMFHVCDGKFSERLYV